MNYFIVGIKGTAMSNLAVILKQMGHSVLGCDVVEEFITDPVLKQYDIPVLTGFDPGQLPEITDRVIFSAAHNGAGNPIVKAAIQKGIETVPQAVLLGQLMDGFTNKLAVSGCHGKTTTTSLLAYALDKLGKKPSYMVGTPFFNGLPGGHAEKTDYFVIEADEYGVNPPADKTPKLLYLHPSHIICTNIDFDHPDVYATLEDTKKTFIQFFKNRKLYLCIDDPVLKEVIPRIEGATIKTYGFSGQADLRVVNPEYQEAETSFELQFAGKNLGRFTIRLFGEKSILNTTAVVLLLIELGFAVDDIREAIKDFSAVKRRFELVYQNNSTYLFDDYGHHPNEIAATIAAARLRFPGKRIVVLFQPHTYSRTLMLKDEFVSSLAGANLALIAPIFASARENSTEFHVSSADLENLAVQKNLTSVKAFSSKEAMLEKLKTEMKQGDIIFTIGAGDIYKLKDAIIGIISQVQSLL